MAKTTSTDESYDDKTRAINLSSRTVAALTEELSTLLNAHLELDRALAIMSEAEGDGQVGQLLSLLQRRIKEGAEFSSALSEHPGTFSPTYVNLIRAGELSGNLAEVVGRLTHYLNMMLALKERVLSALIYPSILVLVAGFSIIIVLVFVLPEFEQVFEEMDATLPMVTQVVMGFASIVENWWWLAAGLAFLTGWVVKRRYQDPSGRVQIDSWILRLPFFGRFIKEWETARFARNLCVLTKQGVPVTQSISVAADAVGNRAIAESLHVAAGDLRLGGSISARLLEDDTLPRQASRMIHVGEQSGELAEMLDNVATLYDRRIRANIDRGLALLEPALILALASVIAFIIFAILLAILGLNDVPI